MKCAKCGLRCTKEEAAMQFDDHFNGLDYESEITLGSHEGELCGDCAIDYMEAKIRSQPGYVEDEDEDFDAYDDEDSDEDSGETLNVYDAALIWRSNGMDEDYTFGYTEDELRRAAEEQ